MAYAAGKRLQPRAAGDVNCEFCVVACVIPDLLSRFHRTCLPKTSREFLGGPMALRQGVGIPRLRLATRFPHRQTPLRMTSHQAYPSAQCPGMIAVLMSP